MPFFSIIIPVYNVAPYLRECLDSVLAQTFPDWEAICVDDGSTDGSGAILDEYAAKDTRIRVIHQPNAGVSAARNKGLDIVRGKWIWFVDGDDVINALSLQALANSIKEVPTCELIKIGYEKFNETEIPNYQLGNLTSSVIDVSRYVPVDILDVMCCQVIYRADKVGKIRFKDYIGGEDRVFSCSYLVEASTVVELKMQYYGYRQRTSSVMHRRRGYRKLHDDLCSLIDACKICDESEKGMPFITIWWARMFFNGRCLLEAMDLEKNEGKIIWRIWRHAISHLRCVKKLTLSERITLRLARKMPNLWMALKCLLMINRTSSLFKRVTSKLRSWKKQRVLQYA